MRAIVLPVCLFGALWLALFAQMATGNDPALSNNVTRKVAKAGRKTAPSRPAPKPRRPATVLAYDPLTGMIVRVPASQSQAIDTAPAPAPAPVITSQS